MIRVLIAEDMHMVRGALVALLDLEPDIEVVAQLDNGTSIVDEARRTQPDVAILDIDLPGLDGITAAERLHEVLPQCRTMVVTGMDQPGHLLRALQAHVRGFLLKDAPAEQLAAAIRQIDAGGRVIDPELVAAALDVGGSPFTEREADVLREAATGAPTDEIAQRLNLSAATVRNYQSNASTKVGGRNRYETARIARDAGWI